MNTSICNYRVIIISLVAPTSPPADINIEALNSITFQLSWAPPAHINGIIRKYIINVTEVETHSEMKLVSLELTNTVQPLHPFYHYKCTLSAVTIAPGPWSKPIIIQLPEAGEPNLINLDKCVHVFCNNSSKSYTY